MGMPENKYLDSFTDGIKESGFTIDSEMKRKILRRTHRKIRNQWLGFKVTAAACIILAAVSAFIPNTAANAFCRRLFSFIPGLGVIENSEETGIVRSVLDNPVKVVDGEEFVEIKTAYIIDKTLSVSVNTNVGAAGAGEFEDPAEFKKFFAGETAPAFYLISGTEKIKSSRTSRTGPSFETRNYSMDAAFYFEDDYTGEKTFRFQMQGFDKEIEIVMTPVGAGASPESFGNTAVIDNVIVFADVKRDGGVLEVLLSSAAPKDFENISFHLSDSEKGLFESGVYMTDRDGELYLPNDELREKNNDSMNHFYFMIPADKEGLELVVPQILYSGTYRGTDMKISMPEPGREQKINKALDLPGSTVLIEKASIVPQNDPLLPEELRSFDCLRIDAGAKNDGSREKVCRVIPDIEVRTGIFSGYMPVSQSTYAEHWNSVQKGYSLTSFEGLDSTRKISISFDVEYAMTGPWKIRIQ